MKKRITSLTVDSLLGAGVLQATTVSFDSSTNASVNVVANWDTNAFPKASDDVVIGPSFSATGNLGGERARAKAKTLLVQGSLTSTWILNVTVTVDGGKILLFGAAIPYSGTVNLINGGTFTFTQKTAAEFMKEYSATFLVNGQPSVFGSDPLVIEPGDTALITENAKPNGDNITISMISVPQSPPETLLGIGGVSLILRQSK